MTSIEIELSGAQAIAKKTGRLTSGMVGVPVKFSVDEHWDGLNIIPVFKCGDITKDNILANYHTTVPHELLQQVGYDLYVGAEGRSEDGRLVIPTTWVKVGQVFQGVKATGDLGLEPTPSQFDHFMAEVGKIDNKVMNAVKDVVDSGALRGEKGDTGAAGADGKSAYEYAKDRGYTGTEEAFATKLASESANIYVGTEAPTDENVNVWIDTDEETPETGSGVDVTAEVGQTVIVEEVDENGKPTKWKAADYQSRTHWEEKDTVVIVEERKLTFSDQFAYMQDVLPLIPGGVYTVYFDDAPYKCRCVESTFQGIPDYALGNESISFTGENTDEPFVIGVIPAMNASAVMVADSETTHTLKITQDTIHPLDNRYFTNDFRINITGNETDGYSTDKTAREILNAYNNGKAMLVFHEEQILNSHTQSMLRLTHINRVSSTDISMIIFSFLGAGEGMLVTAGIYVDLGNMSIMQCGYKEYAL